MIFLFSNGFVGVFELVRQNGEADLDAHGQ
jgi:hypothetical protein